MGGWNEATFYNIQNTRVTILHQATQSYLHSKGSIQKVSLYVTLDTYIEMCTYNIIHARFFQIV